MTSDELYGFGRRNDWNRQFLAIDIENKYQQDITTYFMYFLRCNRSNRWVKSVIKKHRDMIDVNFRDWQGRSVAYWACREANLKIVRYFCNVCKPDLTLKTWDGKTCLMAAALTRNFSVCLYLLKYFGHIFDLNEQDSRGNSALHHLFLDSDFHRCYMRLNGAYNALEVLQRMGGNVHLLNNDGLSPLQLAFYSGCMAFEDIEKEEIFTSLAPLIYAEYRHYDLIEDALKLLGKLLKLNPLDIYVTCLERFIRTLPFENDAMIPLFCKLTAIQYIEDAIESKTLLELLDSELLKFSLKIMGVKFLEFAMPHLRTALELSKIRPMHIHTNWEGFFRDALHLLNRDVPFVINVVRDLCEMNPRIPKNGKTLLHLACRYFWDSPILIHNLLNCGFDVHARDCMGNTPLHLAYNKDLRSILIEVGGAHGDAVNHWGTEADWSRKMKPLTLQCLASRAVAIVGEYHPDRIPYRLRKLINIHSEKDIYKDVM